MKALRAFVSWLAAQLIVEENELTSPRAWLDGLYSLLLRLAPWTRDHKVGRALAGRVLYECYGHVSICCFSLCEHETEKLYSPFWLPADNALDLEAEARAYLAEHKPRPFSENLWYCPRELARRAIWADNPPAFFFQPEEAEAQHCEQ